MRKMAMKRSCVEERSRRGAVPTVDSRIRRVWECRTRSESSERKDKVVDIDKVDRDSQEFENRELARTGSGVAEGESHKLETDGLETEDGSQRSARPRMSAKDKSCGTIFAID